MQRILMTTLALTSTLALAGGAGMAPMGPVSTAQVSNNTNVLFMEVAAMSNLTEIMTSQLALQKSSNAQVRAFAQHMIEAHTQAHRELLQLAAMKGVKLTDKPGADQRLQYNKLTTLSGAAFDAMYKKVQVQGHEMTLDLIKTYRTIGTDAQVLAYAAKMQPAVAMHLEEAKALPGM
ncbi:DUF4142 domain-containing protein [Deinococcus multiflagellatus]|uniref:DUF4142 domain-containing protein n=1 Tax=Deinococcus multiflagellatus TaxID=1656887 RepID=A0ABW1ZG63_9DEIO|nr:DUF4142 domain-containing protein [Deinococcus multiflagellatus]MBZ9712092.1 DUF4142 domain-containing protein [Deinococcus multiflagellatus]